jgi:diguanylate cyclase (GGDEF)-like protein/PAS domain S-box-containing protein
LLGIKGKVAINPPATLKARLSDKYELSSWNHSLAVAMLLTLPLAAAYFGLEWSAGASEATADSELRRLVVIEDQVAAAAPGRMSGQTRFNETLSLIEEQRALLQNIRRKLPDTALPDLLAALGRLEEARAQREQLLMQLAERAPYLLSPPPPIPSLQPAIHDFNARYLQSRVNAWALPERLRWALTTYALVLLGYTAYLLWHLRRSSRKTASIAGALEQEAKQHEQAKVSLMREQERVATTLRSIADGVITTDTNGTVTFLNPVAEQLSGWKRKRGVGQFVGKVFHAVRESTREPAIEPLRQCLHEGQVFQQTQPTLLLNRLGAQIPIQFTAAPIREAAGTISGVVIVFQDVSMERELRGQLDWEATHDRVTGLINRRRFESVLDDTIARRNGADTPHSLLYLDMDQFKLINETSGHDAGDELLRRIAGLLHEKLPESATLARLGGDEFGIILDNMRPAQAVEIAEGLRQAVRNTPYTVGDRSYGLGVSIGLVPIPPGHADSKELLSAADVAAYLAKESGRNRVHVYEPGDKALARRRGEMHWATLITQALEKGRLQLFFQKIVPIARPAGGELHGEFLLRHVGDNGDAASAASLLAAAERFHLMPLVDRWVLRNTLGILKNHRERHGNRVTAQCAINISGATLADTEFLDYVRGELQRYGIPPAWLCLEITENAAIANFEEATRFMHELKRDGLRFALDDFGVGMSSFYTLKKLPVDYLKIDGQFVRDLTRDAVDDAMVQAINHVGHVIGIQTVAEFVETEETLQRLRTIGVDYAQGFHVHVPEPFPSA